MARYDTALNVINDVSIELGLGSVADAYGSSNELILQLRTLLKSTGRGLVLRHPWLQQTKAYTLTTDGDSTYSLPSDFQSMLEASAWNRTTQRENYPASAAEWQRAQARGSSDVMWRVNDRYIELWPQPPPAGETLAFEYRSRFWVQQDGATEATSDEPSANTDTLLLDVHLLTRALKLSFLRAKGFDTTAAQIEFDEAFAALRNANTGPAPKLRIDGHSDEEPLISMNNAGNSGFGLGGSGGLF